MRTPILLLFEWLAFPALSQAAECPFQGTWKSDAARTLADIAANNAIAPRSLNSYSNDFFGHMIHEWTCTEFRAWFDYQPRPSPTAYRISSESEETLLVTFPSEKGSEFRLVREGDCYKTFFGDWKWHEYFCPVEVP